ncbi:hypothetical protein BK702_03755 [Bacillus thuringiensis serovar cameroun]|nr:hypothetical protein BK702_03755 [Bacillus thuringiensis serovar cameroun]
MEQIRFEDIQEGQEFQSYQNYVIEFSDELLVDEAEVSLGTYFQKVGKKIGILNYKNYVGNTVLVGKHIIVKSNKISSEDYEMMLKDIVEKMAQLPFDFNSPTYEPFNVEDLSDRRILYHLFVIVKYIVFNAEMNLQGALECITRNPTRKHVYELHRVETWNVNHITSHTISSIVTHPQTLEDIPSYGNLNDTSLARRIKQKNGKAKFPMYVDSMQLNNSLDTVENRFVKHFLIFSLEIIEQFYHLINKRKDVINKLELIRECRVIKGIVEEWLTHDLFAEVGELHRLSFQSVVLQKRVGYKDIFRFYNMLNSSLHMPFSPRQLERIIQNKDIALLYEIWTYFEILNAVEECIKMSPKRAVIISKNYFKVNIKEGIEVVYDWQEGEVKVGYNNAYPNGKGSYSVRLRPDIVIEYKDKTYIFDAKFKVKQLDKRLNKESRHQEEQDYTFKNEDIYKMHTYKDAIDGVCIACILYPNPNSNEIVFLTQNDQGDGVGAIPLLPSQQENKTIVQFLKEKILKKKR